MQTSEGTLLKNGSKLGKIMVAQPLPPLFKTDQSLGKTALRAFTWIQQSFLVKNFKNINFNNWLSGNGYFKRK